MAEPVRMRRWTDEEGRCMQAIVRLGWHGLVRVWRALITVAPGAPVPASGRLAPVRAGW